jgi:hypothetical protein
MSGCLTSATRCGLLGLDERINDREKLLLGLRAQALDLLKPPFQSRAQRGAGLAGHRAVTQELLDRDVEKAREAFAESLALVSASSMISACRISLRMRPFESYESVQK